MRYALIENNVVKLISYQPMKGFVEVSENVCADMVKKEDGTFGKQINEYTRNIKQRTK